MTNKCARNCSLIYKVFDNCRGVESSHEKMLEHRQPIIRIFGRIRTSFLRPTASQFRLRRQNNDHSYNGLLHSLAKSADSDPL